MGNKKITAIFRNALLISLDTKWCKNKIIRSSLTVAAKTDRNKLRKDIQTLYVTVQLPLLVYLSKESNVLYHLAPSWGKKTWTW